MMTKKPTDASSQIRQLARQIVSLLICLILLSGCHIPSTTQQLDTRSFENISDFATNPIDIVFQLELPEPISDTEIIILEIIDDVTGLPYNLQRYQLERLSDQTYQTMISIPSGSVIKYRYGKMGEAFLPEVTPDGNPIAYRLYYAPTHATVKDVLQAWQGELHASKTGVLTGRLLEQETNLPIPDIVVSAGGRRTFTDANGKYLLEGLGPGVHNVVFFAMDGKYRTYQQGALIEVGMRTSADVKLVSLPLVTITFQVTPPNDAQGAPIHLAGNILQLGNTFTDLSGSMSINPKRMPNLTQNSDGTLAVSLQLFTETDLRYKFTLGDGYWNSEQYRSGGMRLRQLIVPSEDVTINHRIESWRTAGIEPITFSVKIPPGTAPFDAKFIQFEHFNTEQWTEPIPLWPLGNNQYLYILFSPLISNQPIKYQFCRNENCDQASDTAILNLEREIIPSDNPQTVTHTLDSWQNWYPLEKNAAVLEAYIPTKPAQYKTMIELSPLMNPSWLTYAPISIKELGEMGADTIIFSPQWTVAPQSPYLRPELGTTPYYRDLTVLLSTSNSQGFDLALFPQLGPLKAIESFWLSGTQPDAWWEIFFSSYRDFLLNYAKLAQDSNVSHLIIGGKPLLPTFEGGLLPDGSDSKVPSNSDEYWLGLINDVQNTFDGDLIWATNVHISMDPLPNFIGQFDEIYISVDSPLAYGDHPSFEKIQSGFVKVIDSLIYEVYRSTQKPITLALAYPAVETAPSGCALLNEACYNDGLFFATEITPFVVDLQEQALIYNAIFPIIASRDWITSTSIRGYDPTVIIHDGASSIFGKPSFDVVQYWFTSMKP